MELTQKEIENARSYIICRSTIKAIMKDKKIIDESDLELKEVYLDLLEKGFINANNELRQLNRLGIAVSRTSQPTVYDVWIGKRRSLIEMNVLEIVEGISRLINKKILLS